MTVTYPNQKTIIINKPVYDGDYLSVGNSEWTEACNNLTYSAFKLYLYLSKNKDGFDLALSKKAVQNIIKMSDNTYSNVVKELTEKNYIVPRQGSIYDFYTVPLPHSNSIPQTNGGVYPNTAVDNPLVKCDIIPHSGSREISNITNKNNLSKEADAKKEIACAKEEREESLKDELDNLSTEQLEELAKRFELGKTDRVNHGYKALKKDFKLKNNLDKNLGKIIENMLEGRRYIEAQLKAREDCYIPPEYSGGAEYKPKEYKKLSPELAALW